MSQMWCRWTSWVAVVLLLMFMAAEVQARGGRGKGGGGGGKNFSSGGPASRGSLKGNRSYSGNRGNRQANRQNTAKQMHNRRQVGETARQRDRQNTARDLQANRQDFKRENREDWQDYGNRAREDRQEYRDKARDEWKEVADDRNEWGDRWEHPVATGLAVGAAMAMGTAITASAFNALTCPAPVIVNGVYYYNCGGAWYSRGYRSGSVTYIVVNAPVGY